MKWTFPQGARSGTSAAWERRMQVARAGGVSLMACCWLHVAVVIVIHHQQLIQPLQPNYNCERPFKTGLDDLSGGAGDDSFS